MKVISVDQKGKIEFNYGDSLAVNDRTEEEFRDILKNSYCIWLKAKVVAKDRNDNEYLVDHYYKIDLEEAKGYVKTLRNIIYKKNLLHIGEDGNILVIPKFEFMLTDRIKKKIDDAIFYLSKLRHTCLCAIDKKKAIAHRRIRTVVFQMNNKGRKMPKYIMDNDPFYEFILYKEDICR